MRYSSLVVEALDGPGSLSITRGLARDALVLCDLSTLSLVYTTAEFFATEAVAVLVARYVFALKEEPVLMI